MTLPLVSPPNDWLNQISHAAQPIRSTTKIWVVTCHQYGISALVSQASFGRETSGSVAKCRLFSQAILINNQILTCSLQCLLHRNVFQQEGNVKGGGWGSRIAN